MFLNYLLFSACSLQNLKCVLVSQVFNEINGNICAFITVDVCNNLMVFNHTMDHSEFSELCRICGSKTSVLMGLHIFEREGNMRQIYKKITDCLPIQVSNVWRLYLDGFVIFTN